MRSICSVVFVATLLVATGCGGTQAEKDARLQATAKTLNAIAHATDVAWAAAMEAQLQELRAYASSVDPDTPYEEALARLEEIEAKWDERFAYFKRVREAHETAQSIFLEVRNGNRTLSALLPALDEVLELYQGLREMLRDSGVDG